ENYPVITFSEAYAPDADPGLQHKRMPQDEMLASTSKAVFYRSGTDLDVLVQAAGAELPGPVHLNLVEAPGVSYEVEAPRAAGDLGAILDRIKAAHRPVVIGG